MNPKLKCPFCENKMKTEIDNNDQYHYYCCDTDCCFRFISVMPFHIEDLTEEINKLKEYKWKYEDLCK